MHRSVVQRKPPEAEMVKEAGFRPQRPLEGRLVVFCKPVLTPFTFPYHLVLSLKISSLADRIPEGPL